jgi:hypothetical protein
MQGGMCSITVDSSCIPLGAQARWRSSIGWQSKPGTHNASAHLTTPTLPPGCTSKNIPWPACVSYRHVNMYNAEEGSPIPSANMNAHSVYLVALSRVPQCNCIATLMQPLQTRRSQLSKKHSHHNTCHHTGCWATACATKQNLTYTLRDAEASVSLDRMRRWSK